MNKCVYPYLVHVNAYTRVRFRRIEHVCRPVVKDGAYQFDSDEIKENTIKEIGEINDTEVEIELMPLSLELIETCDSGDYDSISLKEMETLEFMIQE